jgi:hypothetical protein
MYIITIYFDFFMSLGYIQKMRPKKHPSDLREVSCHILITKDEKLQFNAQAKIHSMELSSYFRSLAVKEGERLVTEGKIRHAKGKWEVFLLGKWRAVHI